MPRHWQVLIVVTAGAFLANLDLFIVNIAFPAIAADFPGVGIAGLSWVLNGYAIVFAALLVPAGRLADRVGRKRVFMAGLWSFTAASALCAAAPGPWWLVAARVAQAVGAALMIPTSLALLLPEFPPARRPAAVGLWTAGAALAATMGPTIGGLLVTASWRWVFLVNIPLGLVTAVAGARILRESRDPDRGRVPDLLGAAALCIGVGALALAIVEGEGWGWTSPGVLGAAALAAAALALVVRRSLTHPVPVVEPSLLRPRVTRAADAGVFLFSMGFFPLLLVTVLFMTDVWGYSVLQAGLAIAPGPLMVALLSWPAGVLAARFGPRLLVLPGVGLFAAGCAWSALTAGTTPDYLGVMLPATVLTGIGVALTFPVLAGAAVAGLPPARAATGSALFTMSRQIGGVVGIASVVAVLAAAGTGLGGFQAGWAFIGAAAIAAGLVALALPGRRPAAIAATAVTAPAR
ncbi:MAG: DHA2 family efflux MFS transporter permease subunit [Thermoleophilia bacterium]